MTETGTRKFRKFSRYYLFNIVFFFFELRARAGPGPALDRTFWTGPTLAPGQGQLRVDRTSRARARATKIGRGPARTDPWTV